MDQGNILKSLEILPWGGYNMTLQNQINLDSSIQDIKKKSWKRQNKIKINKQEHNQMSSKLLI